MCLINPWLKHLSRCHQEFITQGQKVFNCGQINKWHFLRNRAYNAPLILYYGTLFTIYFEMRSFYWFEFDTPALGPRPFAWWFIRPCLQVTIRVQLQLMRFHLLGNFVQISYISKCTLSFTNADCKVLWCSPKCFWKAPQNLLKKYKLFSYIPVKIQNEIQERIL